MKTELLVAFVFGFIVAFLMCAFAIALKRVEDERISRVKLIKEHENESDEEVTIRIKDESEDDE
jgi:uncharacterized membrane protein YciS (DUF1049 family)